MADSSAARIASGELPASEFPLMPRTLRTLAAMCALIAIITGTPCIAAEQPKRLVTLNDLEGVSSGKSVIAATLHVSADSRWLAVERGHRLWMLDVKTGRVLKELGEGLIPLWSPDGERLAFYSNRSGALQLWIWSVETGQAQQLTDFPSGIDPDPVTSIMGFVPDAFRYSWSPDGARIVFASRVGRLAVQQASEGVPLILTNSTSPDLTLSGVFAHPVGGAGGVPEARDGRSFSFRAPKKGEVLFNQLFIVDTRTHALTQITSGSRSFFHPAWSPNGRAIVVAATGVGACETDSTCGNSLGMVSRDGEIILLQTATRQQRVLATGAGVKHRPRWSPDGSRVAYLANGTLFEWPKMIHVVRPAGGEGVRVGLQLDRMIADYDWASASDEFLVQYYHRGSKLGRFSFGAHSVSTMPPDTAISASIWSQARDGLIAWLKGHAGPDLSVLPAGAEKPVQIFDLDPAAKKLKLGRVESVRWRNERGDELEGTLLYPPEYREGERYPLIVDAYPIVGGSMWMHPMEGNQSWASAGYVVFKPMPRSPHNWMACTRSPDFCRASKGPGAWNVMVDDLMSGVDEIISRGIADPQRMCLYGHSNGATTVNYLVTRTNRFNCAVSVASSLADWAGPVLLETEESIAPIAGVKLWEDPTAYIQLSAVYYLDRVKTPMLLAAGDKDGPFLLGTVRMYNGLRHAGAEVTFLRYPDQGHLFTGAAMQDFWERQMTFFAKYLKPSRQN